MINTITMSEDNLKLLLAAMTLIGAVYGYIMGRVVSYFKRLDPPKARRPRRTPEQRHTRSHW